MEIAWWKGQIYVLQNISLKTNFIQSKPNLMCSHFGKGKLRLIVLVYFRSYDQNGNLAYYMEKGFTNLLFQHLET